MAATVVPAKPAGGDASTGAPAKAGIVLGTLIIVAAVANLPLAMANVALPRASAPTSMPRRRSSTWSPWPTRSAWPAPSSGSARWGTTTAAS